MSEVGLCTWHNCRLPRASGSMLCEKQHKTGFAEVAVRHVPPAKEIDPPPKMKFCIVCGKPHGPVGELISCLEEEVKRQRGYINTLRGMLAKVTGVEDA